ncbi:MAG TPA: adenine phosphoribosyltransferase [Polyangiaceae bacterium]
MNTQLIEMVKRRIRDVPGFPKPGVLFKDITPVLADPAAFHACLELMDTHFSASGVDAVVGIESRGFIFGAALAARMHKAFVPARRAGKLPAARHRVDYEFEYGSGAVEIHRDALRPGEKVLIVDDLLATGGTAAATVNLVQKAGGQVVGVTFVIELTSLAGRTRLEPIDTFSIVQC